MPRSRQKPLTKKIFKIPCIYCLRKFEYAAYHAFSINRVHCQAEKCIERYREINKKPKLRIAYLKYREQIRNRFSSWSQRSNMDISFRIKGNKLFRGEIDLGKIKGEDESHIFAQKSVLHSVLAYNKKYVENIEELERT